MKAHLHAFAVVVLMAVRTACPAQEIAPTTSPDADAAPALPSIAASAVVTADPVRPVIKADPVRPVIKATRARLAASANTATKPSTNLGIDLRVPGTLAGDDTSSAMRIVLGLTLLAVVPALLVCITAFLRIVIVLSMLRHAIGMPGDTTERRPDRACHIPHDVHDVRDPCRH